MMLLNSTLSLVAETIPRLEMSGSGCSLQIFDQRARPAVSLILTALPEDIVERLHEATDAFNAVMDRATPPTQPGPTWDTKAERDMDLGSRLDRLVEAE